MKSRYFIGIMLVIFGSLFLLENLNIIASVSLWTFLWPLLFLGLGFTNIANNKKVNSGDVFLILIGCAFLANSLGLLTNIDPWTVIFPLALVFLGAKLILHNSRANRYKKIHNGQINVTSVFSGSENKYAENDFQNGEANAVFGSCYFDLSRSYTTSSRCYLEVNAIFGGAEIIIPYDWDVEIKVSSIIGGCDNKTTRPSDPKSTLVITGSAIFGGVEIKNPPNN